MRVIRRSAIVGAALIICVVGVERACAAEKEVARSQSITDRSIEFPSAQAWRRVLLLEDYNTRVVVLGASMLGLAAGTVGSLTLLRKRALMGDALSHATLPGIVLAFIVATALAYNGKSLFVLMGGAAVSGVIGMAGIVAIRSLTRLKEDAALGIVLSVFFGAGIVLLTIAQQMSAGHAAGLESFIYGKTASMVETDAKMIGVCGLACAVVCVLLFKEFELLCFDETFARSIGYRTIAIDVVLMVLVIVVTIIGLQAVGLILMIALLVIPAAAARFWTEAMTRMMLIAAALGAASAFIGSAMSALFSNLPSGAMIVLVAATFFLFSLVFGSARGVLLRAVRRRRLGKKMDRRHLLRGMYERIEALGFTTMDQITDAPSIDFRELLEMRSWSARRLRRAMRRAEDDEMINNLEFKAARLTRAGYREAERMVHEHRLWELYLITHADIAPSKVDHEADTIEHVLDAEMITELESILEQRRSVAVPESPHPIELPANAPPVALTNQEG